MIQRYAEGMWSELGELLHERMGTNWRDIAGVPADREDVIEQIGTDVWDRLAQVTLDATIELLETQGMPSLGTRPSPS
jgi:hypothetical protein